MSKYNNKRDRKISQESMVILGIYFVWPVLVREMPPMNYRDPAEIDRLIKKHITQSEILLKYNGPSINGQ
jgi:hypothetical protein